jgi:CHAT domain-containing protein
LEEEHSQPARHQRREALRVLSGELNAAEHEYQDLINGLRRTQPGYASARSLSVPTPEQVQKLLPGGAALIEYLVTPEGVVAFVLTTDAIRAKKLPLRREDLKAKVELVRELFTRVDSNEWQGPAKSLRCGLVDPLERAGWLEGIERLYIVPHGILHYLPFQALPSEDRFLVDDYVLHYLPAATALVGRNAIQRVGGSLLAMAPTCARLRYAREEVRAVAQLFHQKALVGDDASETAFKRLAGGYEILHLATHGFFNKLNPLFSGVELEPDEREDGLLQVHEILELRLDARLVVLSACDTALGTGYFAEVPAGDDFVGLTRAFLYAGGQSVLSSLWEVDDELTLCLMRRFYQHLPQTDPARALAEAQREVLRDREAGRHPYRWASFILVGGTSGVKFSTENLMPCPCIENKRPGEKCPPRFAARAQGEES